MKAMVERQRKQQSGKEALKEMENQLVRGEIQICFRKHAVGPSRIVDQNEISHSHGMILYKSRVLLYLLHRELL